ncbi:MAG: sodium:calcium antiporter [Candidatus Aenigmarchaeota archaeon]|nr:sodium:calcium antiporter [Candidatus Aenigmarchaeota archaeon]
MVVTDIALLIGSLVVVALSSRFVLNYSLNIANATRLGEMVFGFIVLSLMTNLPEFTLAGTAVLTGSPNVSIGNLVGGNVYNIAFSIGLMAIITTISIRKEALRQMSKLLFFVAGFTLLVIIANWPFKILGAFLIVFYAWFIWTSIKGKLKLRGNKKGGRKSKFKTAWIFGLVVSMAAVIASASIAVNSAIKLSEAFGISQLLIGSSIFAIATNLPELMIAIRSASTRHTGLGLGSVLGSNLTGITLVMGLVFLLSPTISLDYNAYSTAAVYLLGLSLLLWFLIGRGKLERPEGILLVSLYVIFILVSFGFSLAHLTIPLL